MIELLLSHKDIDVNAVTDQKSTALHLAVQKQSVDAVNALLMKDGIDVNMPDCDGVLFSFIRHRFISH